MTTKDLHLKAMNHADRAMLHTLAGRPEKATSHLRAALAAERAAAMTLHDDPTAEPSRSVLFRSAATLAIDVGDHAEALRLADLGLTPHTPAEIRAELEAVRAEVMRAQAVPRG